MNVEQVKRFLDKHLVESEISYSGISKSEYITFTDKNDNEVKLRISNHDLPASYQGRNFDDVLDYRFSDSFTHFKKTVLEKIIDTTVKAKKEVQPTISDEQIEFMLSEIKAFNGNYELIFRIYKIAKNNQKIIMAKIA